MLDQFTAWALKMVFYLILFTVLYNVNILVTKFRCVKFAWKHNMFFLPLFPFVGTAYLAVFGTTKASMLNIFLVADKYFGGLPCNFWYGSRYNYATNNAEETRIILNHPHCLNKAEIYDIMNVGVKNSLLTIPVETWKPRRHYLRSAFKTNFIKSSYLTYYQQSCLLLQEIKKLAPRDNLFIFFNKYAFMNFFLSSFGLSDANQCNINIARFGLQVDAAQDEFMKIFSNPAIPFNIWKRSPLGAKFRKIEAELKGLLKDALADYVQQHKQDSEYLENPSEKPLIRLLLDDVYKEKFDADLYEEFSFMTGAATESTAHTLAFCFLMLGMYPEVQARAYEEIQSVLGDRTIEFEDIAKLKYIEAVVFETLRVLPTVPLFGRYCSEDIDLGTQIIPKGANVIVSAYHLHRDPKYWENPLKFDPTRFLPENASKIIPGSYVPFSAGARNCLGQSWATILSKMTVANVVRFFTLTTSHKSLSELVLESCITMKTINHLDCQFIPRK